MTLDEQIRFLSDEACWALGRAQVREVVFNTHDTERRERAAMLLTIENTLRALRDEAR